MVFKKVYATHKYIIAHACEVYEINMKNSYMRSWYSCLEGILDVLPYSLNFLPELYVTFVIQKTLLKLKYNVY